MANTLNDYFSKVFTTEDLHGNLPTVVPQTQGVTLHNFIITENEILSVINSMNVNKTPEPDKISPRDLKEARNKLVKLLTTLFNNKVTSRESSQ